MRTMTAIAVATMLAACGRAPEAASDTGGAAPRAEPIQSGWALVRGSDGTGLVLHGEAGEPRLRLSCASRDNRLQVNVPSFTPVGSEDRLSFGGGGEVVALVADIAGDQRLGGVTGSGPIPDELKRLVIAPMSASYGAQRSGPHQPPPDSLAGPFLSACSEALTAARVAASKPTPATHPCHVQDGELLRIPKQKALGTEPFWAATVDGRCVTYSTPDDIKGTRIWTKVGTGPMGPIWTGTYQGKPFILRTQPAVRCSDGMSDKVYDIEAMLTVSGEERKGCGERL